MDQREDQGRTDFRKLRYFRVLAETLNFRRAAESLGIAQPSLSRHIRELEEDLGVKLFERNKRKVSLTSAGTELLSGVRAILDQFESTTQRVRDAQAGRRGALAIGTVGMVMISHLPELVRAFRAEYPAVEVAVSIMRSPSLMDALRRRRVQIAFTPHYYEPDELLTGRTVWEFPPSVVLPRGHRLAGEDVVNLGELSGETLFVHPRRADAYRDVMALCRDQRFVPGSIKEVPEVADLETLIGMVACGLGVTILPSTFEPMATPAVAFKAIATDERYRVSACWHRDEASPLVAAFLRKL